MVRISQRSVFPCLCLFQQLVDVDEHPYAQSSWYTPWGHANPEFKNLFNDLDPKSHSALRRKVASAYSMSSLVSYEPYVDECTTILLQRLSELGSSGVAFNMGHWFQCYAFETIGMITVSPLTPLTLSS